MDKCNWNQPPSVSGRGRYRSCGAVRGPLGGSAQEQTLFVNTWGGSSTAAEDAAYFKPFTEKTGINSDGGACLAKLKAQVSSKAYEWDISNVGVVEYAQAVAKSAGAD